MDALTVRLAHQVCDGALAWLDRVRGCFALPRGVPDHEIDGSALKALMELSLAAWLVQREAVAGPDSGRTADGLLRFAWNEFREGDLLYRLQRHTPAATFPLEVYSIFAAAGLRHSALEELIAYQAGLRASRVLEHVPNRCLAVLAAARRTGLPPMPDAADVLTPRTWLGGTPEPWMLDGNNAYGMTHTVFHLTDWGARPEGLPPALDDYLRRWLPVWVEVFDETAVWDLLGELLAVDMCLRAPDFYRPVWEHLARAQRDDGMVPNGLTRPSQEPEIAFLNHHHPTIVAVVAGTVTVARAMNRTPAPAPA
ncbi:DUF6895 family protein [Streptomyces salyersiae]|uniref:DUF6895 domain-containing protein n=1 Tax=Streptomyces salyersiae TaxID=3075530 RepID=A0ABU2RUB1_9ACTN|nr:hypothetical protein [Streptomyces sp. DSM 41770]MDT0430949.1 hypothetical protein [Streptomyces sp. DSM 41770]